MLAALVWVGAILAGVVVLLLAALVLPLRIAFRADERGLDGSVAWLGWAVRIDRRQREWELRVLGLRLVRRPIRTDDKDREEEGEPGPKAETKWRGYPLSAISTLRLARLAPHEVRSIKRRVHVDRLRLRAVIATPDPALTGEIYGYGCAATYATRAWWPGADIDIGVDFTTDLPRGTIDAEVHARPIWFALAALRIGWVYLRETRRSRRTR